MPEHTPDYYDDMYRQRGASEAFEIAADDARKLRKENTRLRNDLEKSNEYWTGYGDAEYELAEGSCKMTSLRQSAPDLLTALKAVKTRLHFVGLPSEPIWEGRPDWRKEIELLETAIAKVERKK